MVHFSKSKKHKLLFPNCAMERKKQKGEGMSMGSPGRDPPGLNTLLPSSGGAGSAGPSWLCSHRAQLWLQRGAQPAPAWQSVHSSLQMDKSRNQRHLDWNAPWLPDSRSQAPIRSHKQRADNEKI